LPSPCLAEIAAPEPTVPLPGQQTETRWDTPRGCGVVLVDDGAPPESAVALMLGALLAGNGVVVIADARHRRDLVALAGALRDAGTPDEAVVLSPPDLDVAAAIALPAVTFAAVDAALRNHRRALPPPGRGERRADASCLKALISLVDGPRPGVPGFLRRFALPKTVAVQTLHLGADLELLTSTGE
jgi:hypothetical protein